MFEYTASGRQPAPGVTLTVLSENFIATATKDGYVPASRLVFGGWDERGVIVQLSRY